ncbi:NAD(P)-dependent oxidoreductase [Alphaproteobacteria bacterium]|nr:NAD(P)-dependent oxidoreductase [Alphaproteobacteria bacterium]MDC0624776.1 NAD(P)-dependent oxidoreductase [Alphaproteobacteria bacterium]|tara:strand:+ start:57 stop:920 length:864 start_codon:yes stop_codon:yes gene_type:complete
MIRNKVGFIGSGYMGFGMAKNLIKNFDVYVIAHKNRDPINKLVNLGATEILNYKNLLNENLDCLMICVTNTPVAISVAEMIAPIIKEELLVIDLTTHDKLGTTKMKNIFHSKKVKYTVNPVMGGPVQSEEGILGGIWGGEYSNFEESNKYLSSFCKNIFNFGTVEKATKAKLLSNFLSLLTTTTVIEFFRSANKLDIDTQLLCDVAKLGSGNSGALDRISSKALKGDYKGYIFSVNNTLKDLTYISDLLKDSKNGEQLSQIAKSFYESAQEKGFGDLLVSELIEKDY